MSDTSPRPRLIPRRAYAVLLPLGGLALLLSACGSSAHASAGATPTTVSATGDASQSGATSAPKTLTKLITGTPGAPVGVNPELTGPAGFALDQGKGEAILAQYGYTYGGNVGFLSGPPAIQALVSNKIQIASVGSAPAITSRAAGQPTRAIVLSTSKGGTWVVAPKGGITSFAQLKGKTVGSAFGTALDQYIRYALAQTGMTDEVKLANIQTQNCYAALIGHAVAACLGTSAQAETWLTKGGVQVIQKAEDAYPNFYGSGSIVVTQSFLTAHPNIQQAIWALYDEGQTLIKQDTNAYLSWTAKQSGETLAQAQASTIIIYQDAPITTTSLAATVAAQQFLVGQKLTKPTFSIADWAVGTAKP
jgi:sulfonate transport system substrate-binding protein